jgi:hypothetical protein
MIKSHLSKIIALLSLSFAANAFADGVQLCEPLSTSKFKDEIGGVFSTSLDEYISALDAAAIKEGWLTLEESAGAELENKCTRIGIKPTSTLFLYKNVFGDEPSEFLNALSIEKKHIIEFYKTDAAQDQRISISDDEYNRLAFLAAGIMGAESSAGKSVFYFIENAVSKVGFLERIAVCLNKRTWEKCTNKPLTSRGLTQIKKVPYLGDLYGIDRNNLSDPYLSGVATMGFLIETYKWYLGIVSNKKRFYMAAAIGSGPEERREIRKEDFDIFLTYIYRGDTREIINGTATPDKSCYYKRVQKYQEYLRFYIVTDQDCSEAGVSILDKEGE